MPRVIALIPARSGSKGIPGKNFRRLGNRSLVGWAAKAAREAGIEERIVSTDLDGAEYTETVRWLLRPPELAQDDTPMIAVVQHALSQVPGDPDDIWLLLQPTAALRQPKHLRAALDLLAADPENTDSVVSVVEATSPQLLCEITDAGDLRPWPGLGDVEGFWCDRPVCRQQAKPAYRPDGTVYAFYRRTIEGERYPTLYGYNVKPLIIPAEESCELDTMADWTALERRLASPTRD